MGILSHTLGGCIGSSGEDNPVSALLRCASKCRIGWSDRRLANIGSTLIMLRWFSSHDLRLWDKRGRWYRKEVGSPEEYLVSFKSNAIINSQLACSTHVESCCVWLQVVGISHCPAICSNSVQCRLFGYRDQYMLSTAEISWLSVIHTSFHQGKDVWRSLSQDIPVILHDTDAKYGLMSYS